MEVRCQTQARGYNGGWEKRVSMGDEGRGVLSGYLRLFCCHERCPECAISGESDLIFCFVDWAGQWCIPTIFVPTGTLLSRRRAITSISSSPLYYKK